MKSFAPILLLLAFGNSARAFDGKVHLEETDYQNEIFVSPITDMIEGDPVPIVIWHGAYLFTFASKL